MPIRIKIDEDLPAEITHLLQHTGHDVCTVLSEKLTGITDEKLWSVVQQEERWLFTADKGFANARDFPPGTHHGIVLFRLPRESRSGYIRLTEVLLSNLDFEQVKGPIIVVTPDMIRLHRRE